MLAFPVTYANHDELQELLVLEGVEHECEITSMDAEEEWVPCARSQFYSVDHSLGIKGRKKEKKYFGLTLLRSLISKSQAANSIHLGIFSRTQNFRWSSPKPATDPESHATPGVHADVHTDIPPSREPEPYILNKISHTDPLAIPQRRSRCSFIKSFSICPLM